MHPALFWCQQKGYAQAVQCLLCPHGCTIAAGATGLCRVRKNIDGQLFTLNYGQVTAVALDPIEKKPLKQFRAGSNVLSLGTYGCNLHCAYCQNWSIAHGEDPVIQNLSPLDAVNRAQELMCAGNIGLAYTYSEPLMWYEFVRDTAKEAKKAGLDNILVTNGFINPQPLLELVHDIDAVNLDIKAYTNDFYQGVCGGTLEPVLNSARLFHQHCHLEITSLIVPGLNDSPDEILALAQWIAVALDQDVPLHLTRYVPHYKMHRPPTSPDTLKKLKRLAERYLSRVYLGNI